MVVNLPAASKRWATVALIALPASLHLFRCVSAAVWWLNVKSRKCSPSSKTEDLPAAHPTIVGICSLNAFASSFLAELPGRAFMQVGSRESVSIRGRMQFCHSGLFFCCCCLSADADDRSPIARGHSGPMRAAEWTWLLNELSMTQQRGRERP